MTTALAVGDKAPEFRLPSQDGKVISLSELLGRGPVVVYFYPKDHTSGCTAEACSFRDNYEAFQEAGSTVVGISSDSVASHRGFADKHGFPFLLLADAGGAVRKAYKVPRTALGLIPGRVTYVLDRGGVVRMVFESLLNATGHVDEALRVVRSLA